MEKTDLKSVKQFVAEKTAFLVGNIFVYKAPLITTNAKILRGLLRVLFSKSHKNVPRVSAIGERRIGNKNK